MLRYRAGIGVEAVERNQSSDAGEKCQQDVEGHACCKGKDPILAYALIDAKNDILPSFTTRNFGRSGCPAASIGFGRRRLARGAAIGSTLPPRLPAALGPAHPNNTEKGGRGYCPQRRSPRSTLRC